MDKQFWFDIRDNQYAVPEDQSIPELTEELFSYIGSTDPQLRDEIGYETFANWLDKRRYTPEQIHSYIMRLVINLQEGLGERDTDSVFLRAFSVLFLAEIIHIDNKRIILERDDVFSIFDKVLVYLAEEQDPRGYVPEKGWAHALAHTADLLSVLVANRFLTRAELEQILNAIADKVTAPTDRIHAHGEDDRLVRVVIAANQRQLLDEFFMKQWLGSFTSPKKHKWSGSFKDPAMHYAYFNTRNLLRSLHLQVAQNEKLFNRDYLANEIMLTIQGLRQF
jgi:hypothetical protein